MTTAPANVRIEVWRSAAKVIDDISQDVTHELNRFHPMLQLGIGGMNAKIVNTDNAYTRDKGKDTSGQDNDASHTDYIPVDAFAKIIKAAYFDGVNDYVSGTIAGAAPTGAFTFAFFFTWHGGYDVNQHIFRLGNDHDFTMYINEPTGNLWLKANGVGQWDCGILEQERQYFIVCGYTGTQYFCTIDLADAILETDTAPSFGSHNYILGTQSTGTTDCRCTLDEFRYYKDVTLDGDEIVAIYNDDRLSIRRTNLELELKFSSGKIEKFDKILLYLWREGDSEELVGNYKVMLLGDEFDYDMGEYFVYIDCEDDMQESIAPPEYPDNLYVATGGKTILDYLIGLLDVVTLDATDNGAAIDSNHDVKLVDISVYDAIVDLLNAGKSGSDIGFDAYLDTVTKLHVFKRELYTSSVSLATGQVYHYLRKEDIHPLRNIQAVYGAKGKTNPAVADLWCEQVASEPPSDYGWTATDGGGNPLTLTPDWTTTSSQVKVGTEAVRFQMDILTGDDETIIITNSLPSISSIDGRPWLRQNVKKLRFWINMGYLPNNDMVKWKVEVRILAPDTSNYIVSYLNNSDMGIIKIAQAGITYEIELPFEYPLDTETSEFWHGSVGSPDLSNIQGVEIRVENLAWVPHAVLGQVIIDGFHFGDARFYARVDNSGGSAYGIREAKPIVDTSLMSDAECEQKADAELALIDDVIITLEGVIVEGNNGFLPAYKQAIPLQDGTTTTFIISQIIDRVHYTRWDTELQFFREVV